MRNLLAVLLMFFATVVYAKKEIEYSTEWCLIHGGRGKPERLSDGTYADCVTEFTAVEADFAHKWYEAVGQSLHYSVMTGKTPAILLIMRHRDDKDKLKALYAVINKFNLPIQIMILEDYQEDTNK